LYCLVNFLLWRFFRLFLEAIEKHHHVAIVEDEEYAKDVATMLSSQFEYLIAQILDDFAFTRSWVFSISMT
jgi:hypothetical protein